MSDNPPTLESIIKDAKNYFENLKDLGEKELYVRKVKTVPVASVEISKKQVENSTYAPTPVIASDDLDSLHQKYEGCMECLLGESRNKIVFGTGAQNANLMLIGEAPGAQEDATGLPFVGRAGELLDKILAAINLDREQVFIGNIVKCRPPKNRDPKPEEIIACMPILKQQIQIIRPKIILALGRWAGQTLLDCNLTLSKMRGQIHDYNGIKLIVTYHPAALLRHPAWKRPTWEDVKMMKREYDKL